MEARAFNQASGYSVGSGPGGIVVTSQPRKLCHIMTHILSILFATGIQVNSSSSSSFVAMNHRSETIINLGGPVSSPTEPTYSDFTADESTAIYFAITRLFQSPRDASLRKLMYLALRVLATKREPAKDVIMVMSSLLKELSQPTNRSIADNNAYSNNEIRASALRCLLDTSDPSLLVSSVDRVVRELIMDSHGRVASSGAIAISHLLTLHNQNDFAKRFSSELTALMNRASAPITNTMKSTLSAKQGTGSSASQSAFGYFASFISAVADPIAAEEDRYFSEHSVDSSNVDIALAAYHAYAVLLTLRQADKQGVHKLLNLVSNASTSSSSSYTGSSYTQLNISQDTNRHIYFATARQIKLLAEKATQLSEIDSLAVLLDPHLSLSRLNKSASNIVIFVETAKALVSLAERAFVITYSSKLSNSTPDDAGSLIQGMDDLLPDNVKAGLQKMIRILPTFLGIERAHFRLFALRLLSRLADLGSTYSPLIKSYISACNADLEKCISSGIANKSAPNNEYQVSGANDDYAVPEFDLSLSTEFNVSFTSTFSSSSTLSLLAISILLRTGTTSIVNRLINTLMGYLSVAGSNIPDSVKTSIVASIFAHIPQDQSRYPSYISFASTMLHDSGDLNLKKLLVNHLKILLVLTTNHELSAHNDKDNFNNTDASDAPLSALCDYVEDCDYPEVIIPDVVFFFAHGARGSLADNAESNLYHTPMLSNLSNIHFDRSDNVFMWTLPRPERLVRYLTNRLQLESDTVRPAALLALFQMAMYAGKNNPLYIALQHWVQLTQNGSQSGTHNSSDLTTFISHFINKYKDNIQSIAVRSHLIGFNNNNNNVQTQLETTVQIESALLVATSRRVFDWDTSIIPELPPTIAPSSRLSADPLVQNLPRDASITEIIQAVSRTSARNHMYKSSHAPASSASGSYKTGIASVIGKLGNNIIPEMNVEDVFAPLHSIMASKGKPLGTICGNIIKLSLTKDTVSEFVAEATIALFQPNYLVIATNVYNTLPTTSIYDAQFSATIATNIVLGERVIVQENIQTHPSQTYIQPLSHKHIYAVYRIVDLDYWNESVDIPSVAIYEFSNCVLSYRLGPNNIASSNDISTNENQLNNPVSNIDPLFAYPPNLPAQADKYSLEDIRIMSDNFASINL